MYDPQLEKLIAMALQEGVISDIVRSILLRKATELGVDKDELEIDLEMRLAKIKGMGSNAIGIGNDNIVKATIQGGGNAPPPVPMKPIMLVNGASIVKTKLSDLCGFWKHGITHSPVLWLLFMLYTGTVIFPNFVFQDK